MSRKFNAPVEADERPPAALQPVGKNRNVREPESRRDQTR